MSVADVYRDKAGEFMQRSTKAASAVDRDRYFAEASRWHMKALEAELRTASLDPVLAEARSWSVRSG